MSLPQSDAVRILHSSEPASREHLIFAGIPDSQARYQLQALAKPQSLQFVDATTIKSLGAEKRKRLRQYLVKNSRQDRAHAPSIQPSQTTRSLVWRHKPAPIWTSSANPTNDQSPAEVPSVVEANTSQASNDATQAPRPSEARSRSQQTADEPTQNELVNIMSFTLPPGANLRTLLGAGRVDPFDAYSIEFGRFEHQILDFHNNTLPEILLGLKPQAPLCYLRMSIDQAIQDEAIMHLVLSFSMYRWSAFMGRDDRVERKALDHKLKGLETVNRRLSDLDQRADDFNIQSALIMTGIEGRTGNAESFKMHYRGLRSMLKLRGGLTAVKRILAWQLCSSELRLLDKVGIEHMPCQDNRFRSFVEARRLPLNPYMRNLGGVIDPVDLPLSLYLSACVAEFLESVLKFQSLSTARNAYDTRVPVFGGPSYASEECVIVRSTFRPRSPLHMILLPSRGLANDNDNPFAAAIYESDTTRVACLLYIHSTLWSFREQPHRTDAYIPIISAQVVQNNLNKSGSIEALCWVLTWITLNDRDSSREEALERTRHILRLMRVARKLAVDTFKRLERHLFDALVGVESQVGNDSVGLDLAWLEPNGIWRQVFAERD